MAFDRGAPGTIGRWREDFDEVRANLAIEDMPLDAADEAMFRGDD